MAHRAEVKGMLLTEYNEAATMEMFKEDGRKEGILQTLIRLVRRGKLSEEEAAQEANMTTMEFAAEMQKV